MAELPKRERSPQIFWQLQLVLIGIAVVLGAAFVMFLQPDADPRKILVPDLNAKRFTTDESRKLLLLRDRANARLENQEFSQADEEYQEIIRLLPDDPLGHRNLTICRELAVANESNNDKKEQLVSKAQDAANRLLEVDPKSYVSHVLAARVALIANDSARAERELKRAFELRPESPQVLYDLSALNLAPPGELPSPETLEVLRKLHSQVPDNLFLLKDWLVLVVLQRAPDAMETVRAARETIEPYFGVIKQHVNANVAKMMDDLMAAVDAKEWKTAERTVAMLKNVLAPEALRDERYVKYNSLEYIMLDFGSSFYDRADLPESVAKPMIPVKFVSNAADAPLAFFPGAIDILAMDFDLDGQLDGVALYPDRVVFAFPLKSSDAFSPSRTLAVDVSGPFRGMASVDLDDDKDQAVEQIHNQAGGGQFVDPDLILFGPSGVKLFENRKQKDSNTREFVERSIDGTLSLLRDVIAVVPGDYDMDGDLDLLAVSTEGLRLWSNRGNWTFEEITSRSKLPPAEFAPMAAAIVDWDRDTDLDIVVVGSTGAGILENIHHGRFRWREPTAELTSLRNSVSVIVEDLDGNASWDLISAGSEGVNVVLTRTSSGGVVSPIKAIHVGSDPVSKVTSFDLDNDGWRDLLVQGTSAIHGWRGQEGGTFVTVDLGLAGSAKATTTIIADVDRDGDEDLVSCGPDACELALNGGGNANGWLNISIGTDVYRPGEQNYSRRVNHMGIGSSIELRADSHFQTQVVKGPVTHFGLDSVEKADAVRVLGTNGIPRNVVDPVRNTHVFEELKLYGSCPYLYTWDGEKFVFYTDLLWNAPLGLKFAENVVAPWREWEYLKIDGDKLRAKEGQYLLNVTAELWEIEYFDQIKLIAVDHPAGTHVFTNEKVGPPSMAEHAIHTVRTPRVPVAARDTLGRDVLDQIKSRDGVYTKTYEGLLAQGLATKHFLELDLGDWNVTNDSTTGDSDPSHPVTTGPSSCSETSAAAPRVMLYLTGWMYPATTSLNVQFSQNPDGPMPRPPSLHAVDADGKWQEIRPFMGFPGGKTKTIAVDISDVFATGSTDHRLRIVTNMEFYWDAAFFTVDDQSLSIRETELPLTRAHLQDRGGVSLREWPSEGNGPEKFDYYKLVPGDMWAPITGKFTRYGDVLPLLTGRDDQLVVMHPGDEIQLAFAVPADPLPQGWVRDFVIYNVGWDKDCDLNTVYGETSEPLPFREMTVYGETRPVDDEYARYLKRYQTRFRPRSPYWNQFRPN